VENEAVDHILALWVLPSGFWAKDIGKRYNIPYSTWALGSDIWNLAKIPFVRNVLKGVLRNSHMNFADGFKLKNDVAELSGRKCAFLPSTRNLYTPQNKKLTESPPYRLAFLGRWHRNKGVDLLIDSLRHLDDADWSQISEVRVCGGGPMIDQIKTGITTLNNHGRPVVSHGYLKKEEAVELLLWADYVLIPSRIESIPVIFSDAMKCRCPVVCMPVGDLPRLVSDYKIGALAEEVSGQAFANAIKHIVEYSPQDFSDRLDQASKDFNLNHITVMLLNQLINNEVQNVE
ncbi:MAG: glycosyltransferase family 4 protein, partial [Bacteroidetes bacterium]|nr:glycosyltransferase family 4 protein [Bacteroidota bacterium]